MTIALSLFSSILALAYFVYRKWHAASICYGFALAMLIALIPFTTTPPSYLYDLFGEEFCLDLHYSLTSFGFIILAPYAALTLLSILMSIVVTLTVVEHIVLFCRAHREAAVPVHNAVRTKARHAAPQARYNAKKYLFFCSMLC